MHWSDIAAVLHLTTSIPKWASPEPSLPFIAVLQQGIREKMPMLFKDPSYWKIHLLPGIGTAICMNLKVTNCSGMIRSVER